MPFRGTLLNTLTVVVGSLIGWRVGEGIPGNLQQVALTGIGLVTLGLGLQMFLKTRNVLIVAATVALGGVLGAWIGIDVGLANFAEWARRTLGGHGTFNEGLITASVLFCVGPMTLLGCIQDGVEHKIDLLAIKSLLDGMSSLFLSAALGVGVLASAAVVLVVQGLLTAFARPMRGVADKPHIMSEAYAAGGAIILAIGLGLVGAKKIATEVYLPALALAPLVAAAIPHKGEASQGQPTARVP